MLLLGLFAARWLFPGTEHRLWFVFICLGLAGALTGINWRRLKGLGREQG